MWRDKTWQFYALISEEAFVGAAIAHLGYLGFVFATAHDRVRGRSEAFQTLIPLGLGVKVAADPLRGRSELLPPWGLIRMESEPRLLRISLPQFQVDATMDRVEPWRAEWPIGRKGGNLTHKEMGFATAGRLRLGTNELSLQGHGFMDWTRGRPERETQWRWAAGVGRAGDRLVAWNLRTGFDDPTQCENAIWVDGSPRAAGLATIEPGRPWAVQGGGLILSFESEGERRQDLDLGAIASRYQQPWGRFHGTFEGVPLEGYGVVEDHWARW
jgi:hypothetical protein